MKAKQRPGRRNRLKGSRGRGTLDKEKPPILGMIQRNGEVVICMLPNVQQATIQPVIKQTIAPGTLIYSDEYNIYNRLLEWGYDHKTVNHSQGEYARDEDGDGFHEVHIPTPLRGFGLCQGHGCVRIAAFRRKSYQFIWDSSSLSIMFASGAKCFCLRLSRFW